MIQIIGLLIIVGYFLSIKKRIGDWFLTLMPIVFIGTLFLLATVMTSDIFREEINRKDFKQEIVSIRNSSATNGFFFLGSGNISNTEYYFMFTKDKDGAFIRKQVPTSVSRLFLTNDQKPHIFLAKNQLWSKMVVGSCWMDGTRVYNI